MSFWEQITKKLKFNNGIYYSYSRSPISYPDEGNDKFFEIEDSSFWFKHRNDCIKKICTKYLENNFLADIGGGNGFVSKALADEGFDIVLIEPGEAGVVNAKKRGLQKIICSTFQDLDIIKNSFENIGAFDVIEHIESDHDFIKCLLDFLKPEGKLVLTVPAYRFLWSKEDIEAGHFKRYSKNSLMKLFSDFNVKIEYVSYFFSFLVIPIFVFRTIPYIFVPKKRKKGNTPTASSQHKKCLPLIVNMMMKYDLFIINRCKKHLFGSSIIAVVRKL
jgi:SAM-dependent methyltransferase